MAKFRANASVKHAEPKQKEVIYIDKHVEVPVYIEKEVIKEIERLVEVPVEKERIVYVSQQNEEEMKEFSAKVQEALLVLEKQIRHERELEVKLLKSEISRLERINKDNEGNNKELFKLIEQKAFKRDIKQVKWLLLGATVFLTILHYL